MSLSTRSPKRKSSAGQNWPHEFACELDAIPPDTLRELVRTTIEHHLPKHQFEILKKAEESERELLKAWVGSMGIEVDEDDE
jgi:hypothetical protein